MIKTLLFSALVALAASPALAQDAMEDTQDDMAIEMMEDTQEVVEDDAEMSSDDVEIVSETMDAVVATPDTVVLDAPTEPIMPEGVTRVAVACPEGTTAQDDGTCMITGDYEGDD